MRYTCDMGFKAGLVVGAGLGYLFATKIDPQTRNKIEAEVNRRMAQMREDPRVRDVVGSVKNVASEVMDRAAGEVKNLAEDIEDKIDDETDQKVSS